MPTTTATTLGETTTTALDVKTLGSNTFVNPFSMVPEEDSLIRKGVAIRDVYVDFVAGDNEWLVFTTEGERSVERWAALITDGGAVVGEPFSVEVGGVGGTAIDAVSETSEFPMISILPDGQFWAEVGDSIRVYVFDTDGERVSIVITTSIENFEPWIEEIETLLSTLEWGTGP